MISIKMILWGELTICESSNKLSFTAYSGKIYGLRCSDEMTPEEMAKIFLKGLTICSYWMKQAELKELIKNHTAKEIY
ncbi:MAG: hypothetical protein PF440_10635 [Thiomicrorhabdus sp.]|jgi:hypothetical protein|nr:hypothetical protein [Thiomicrorhabdus sp.]